MQKKLFSSIAFYLIILMLFTACAQNDQHSCREILESIMENEVGLPAGKVYDLSADEGDGEFLPEKLLCTLYGDGSRPSVRDGWIDAAIFLPASLHTCEFAVILCNSPDTASDTASLLCRRLDSVRTAKKESEYSSLLDSATVTVIRNYVIFVISSDTDNALKAALKLIK